MTILSRYLTGRFFSMFFLVMPSIVSLYILIDAFEKLGKFMDAKVPFSTVILYFLYSSPKIIFELAPLAILVSGLLSALLLSKNNELLAIKTTGAPAWKIILPFISAAFFTALTITLLNIFIFPEMKAKADYIFLTEVKKTHPKGMMIGNRFYYRGHDFILSAKTDSEDAALLSMFELSRFTDAYRLTETVSAKEAKYKNGKTWILHHGIIAYPCGDGTATSFERIEMKLDVVPKDFASLTTPVSEAGVIELWKMMKRLRKAGLPYSRHETLLWAQLLYCFLGVSLLYIFMPGIVASIKGNPLTGLVTGALAGFAMWFTWSLGVTLGATGEIPPPLAPLGLNILLMVTGYLMHNSTFKNRQWSNKAA